MRKSRDPQAARRYQKWMQLLHRDLLDAGSNDAASRRLRESMRDAALGRIVAFMARSGVSTGEILSAVRFPRGSALQRFDRGA